VIVVKAGRAPDGARSADSRTGALAGSDAVFDAVVSRAGMLRVDTLEALFDAAESLAHPHPQRGECLAITTNGGGAGVLAADALALGGGTLAQLTPTSMAALDQCLPATWSRRNPVDLTAESPVQRYQDALRILLAAPEVDAVLFVHAPSALVPAADIAAACLPLVSRAPKPVLACWLGGPTVAAARASWSAAGIACFSTPERAVAAWLQQVMHARNQLALQQIPPASLIEFTPQRERAQALIDTATQEGHPWLDTVQSMELLQAYGIPVADTRRAHDAEEAVKQAVRIRFPVALKIIAPQIVHKSDSGGVVLNLASPEEVRAAAEKMTQLMAQQHPDAMVPGFAVQAMARRSREIIVGLTNDPTFGPVLLCGSGGNEVELSRQHAVALPPLNTLLARDLIERSGIGPMLGSWRGRPAANEQALIEVLLKVSQMACDLAGIAELDINPLLIDSEGVLALDARVRVRDPSSLAPLAIRPYPQELSESLQLRGSPLLLRPIRPEDGERLKRFYQKAAPADMRLRFFMSRRELPPSELARYSQIDYDREMTFVALGPADDQGEQEMVGEVRAVCDPDNRTAEFAIQIASEWQGKGLGRVMLARLVQYLREHGTGEVIGECLPENASMADLAKSLGFAVSAGPAGEPTALRLALR
jgi:acetyltransferase